MSAKKISYASQVRAEANHHLWEIRDALLIIKHTEEDMLAELARFKESSAYWKTLEGVQEDNRQRLLRADQELKDLMKENREEFFPGVILGSVSLDLPNGALLYDKTEYVVKPRKVDILANLEKYGFEEAIRRTAATDWEALATWTDEELSIIGTRRESRETYGYEVRESSKFKVQGSR